MAEPKIKVDMSDPNKFYTNQNGVRLPRVSDSRGVDGDIRYHNDDGSAVQMSEEDYKKYQAGELSGHYAGVPGSTIQGMGPDQHVPGAAPMNYFDQANTYVRDHLVGICGTGTASLIIPRLADHNKSQMSKLVGSDPNESSDDGLPVGPGKAYLTHLFRTHKVKDKLNELQKKATGNGSNIFTDQGEALRGAIAAIGLYSERNPGGMPLDVKEAKKFWFGDKDIDQIEESEFHAKLQGDTKIDPKRVRKFVNHDGSLTWELLNQDKTVMSRFTMGDYAGTKVFAQGGYNKFAELLKEVKAKKGPDSGGEFDAIRSQYKGD